MTNKIAQGAEAIVYHEPDAASGARDTVLKHRFEKTYRHPELDVRLRKSRTRREAKILSKLSTAQIPAPQLVAVDDKEMKVRMEHIPGKTVKEVIDDLEAQGTDLIPLCNEMGALVGRMHNEGIIHHDLTTSNMIWHAEKKQVVLIDFGLGFFSEKVEDKAVDLHLLKHALESRHHRIWEQCFEACISGYMSVANDAETVMTRFQKVEERGRNKAKH